MNLFAGDGETQNWYEENTFIFDPTTLEDILKELFEETFDKVFKFLEGRKEVLNHRSLLDKTKLYNLHLCK